MTRQEVELFLNPLESIDQLNDSMLEAGYAELPEREFEGDWQQLLPADLNTEKAIVK
jgi:hypothetical protein